MYVSLRKAAEHYNVSRQTIAAWADRGDLEFIKLPSKHRRFRIKGPGNLVPDASLNEETLPGGTTGESKEKLKICYCRVSSYGQKRELNSKRHSLKTILRQCVQGDVSTVCVAHKDRLARFGYDILEYIMGQCGVKLLCDHEEAHTSREKELVDDILSIVTVFSARIRGQRHYKKDTEGDIASNKRSRDQIEAVDGVLQGDIQ